LHGFFFLRFGFSFFGYSGVFIFLPVHVRKRGDLLKPATVFFIASGRAIKNPVAVFTFSASNSPHDDALSTR